MKATPQLWAFVLWAPEREEKAAASRSDYLMPLPLRAEPEDQVHEIEKVIEREDH